jgi:hypothetical protein
MYSCISVAMKKVKYLRTHFKNLYELWFISCELLFEGNMRYYEFTWKLMLCNKNIISWLLFPSSSWLCGDCVFWIWQFLICVFHFFEPVQSLNILIPNIMCVWVPTWNKTVKIIMIFHCLKTVKYHFYFAEKVL